MEVKSQDGGDNDGEDAATADEHDGDDDAR